MSMEMVFTLQAKKKKEKMGEEKKRKEKIIPACVPMRTKLIRGMNAAIAESGMTVVSIFFFMSSAAKSCPVNLWNLRREKVIKKGKNIS